MGGGPGRALRIAPFQRDGVAVLLAGHVTEKTIFGEVTKGYDVVQKIEALGSQSGKPKEKVQILKITLLP